jgi:hypothetical protein
MVSRTKYCIPIDAIRRTDASIEQADIGTNFSIPVSTEVITAHIEGVEDEFERRAIELTDQSKSDELHEGVERDWGFTVYLDESNIKPLDTAQGDKVEIRTGEDTFTDVTDDVFLDEDMGVIEVDQRVWRSYPFYPDDTNYRFRVSYRYGGDSDEAGETTTTGSVPDSETVPFTIGVDDAEEIPVGSIILIGGSEYMFVTSRDTGADTLTIGERAVRGTTADSHDSGDEVNFMPLNVRDAISAKVATRLLRQDDFQDFLNEGTGENIDNQQKIEDLEAEFEAVISRYTTSSGYV